MLAAVAGPAYASRFAGSVWGKKTLNDMRILHDVGADAIASMYKAHGLSVQREVYVRNPFYKVGRRYDVVVRDKDGNLVAIEWKGTVSAAENQAKNQVLADGWIDQHGGTVFGKRAVEAKFDGESISKVIVLHPGKSTPRLH